MQVRIVAGRYRTGRRSARIARTLMARTFTIDPDIRKASTPPGWVYTDPDVLAHFTERVFARSWQLVGDTETLAAPGSVLPCVFLDGLLPEPLVLLRDEAGALACFSNVCTHRANLVVNEPGVVPSLRCRYHGRRFGLDGRFRSMPEFDGVEGFPGPADDLPRVALETWSRFAFAALDPAVPFAEWIAPLETRIGGAHADGARFDAARSRDYEVRASWAFRSSTRRSTPRWITAPTRSTRCRMACCRWAARRRAARRPATTPSCGRTRCSTSTRGASR